MNLENENIPAVSGSYIIRIYDQDLWTPSKCISKKELVEDLEANGLEILHFASSSFGACYFFEVRGDYKGSIEHQKLDTKAEDFCWSV